MNALLFILASPIIANALGLVAITIGGIVAIVRRARI
jgi:hypothetical protein